MDLEEILGLLSQENKSSEIVGLAHLRVGSGKGSAILALQACTTVLSCMLGSFQNIPGHQLLTRLTRVHRLPFG